MITVGIVEPQNARDAYNWHRGFAANSQFIFPRPWGSYQKLIESGQVWCAMNVDGDILGSAYAAFDEGKGEWEIGGVITAMPHRGTGLGSAITKVTLAHMLVAEMPLRRGHRVIAHIHAENQTPRPLFVESLKFDMPAEPREFDAEGLDGLAVNANGKVPGFELRLNNPETIVALASWCEGWSGRLRGDAGEVRIDLPDGLTMQAIGHAITEMLTPPRPTLRRIR